MNKPPEQLIKRYSSCPARKSVIEINGRKFTVTGRFTGEKDINEVFLRLMQERTDREYGLY